MIVADEYCVNVRHAIPRYSWFSAASRTYPGQWTHSLGPHRVRQNVEFPLLKEHGGMIHESGPQSTAFHAAGWYGLLNVRNETGRRFRPAGKLPSENVKISARLTGIRIVEVFSVKVLRKSRIAGTLRHESPFIEKKSA